MEIGRKCQAEGCSNEAIYFHKDFMVNICSDHCKPNQRTSCVKVDERAGVDSIKDMFKVLETCTKNLCISMLSMKNNTRMGRAKCVARQIQDDVKKVEKMIQAIQQKQQHQKLSSIKQKLRNIFEKLKNNKTLQLFCIENYISLVCDFLEVNKFKIGEEFNLRINEIHQMSHNEEAGHIPDKYEQLKQEFQKFKEQAITMLNPITLKGLDQSYKVFTTKKSNIETSKMLHLDFANTKDLEFVKCIGSNIIANLDEFKIHQINDNLQIARDFIFSSFPQRVNRFHLNCSAGMINSDQIIDVVCYISPKISKGIYLYNLEVSQSQMRTLFHLIKDNKECFGFPVCKLELDIVPNLQNYLKGSKIKTLALSYCGRPEYCDWRNHPERFENLIKGLSQSEDFTKNLKKIMMQNCGMPLLKVRKILDVNGFEGADISNHSE